MKKIILMTMTIQSLFAQQAIEVEAPSDEDSEPVMIEMPMIQAGDGAADSAKAAQATDWQNWAVAGGALIAAAIGVVIVATNTGSAADHD